MTASRPPVGHTPADTPAPEPLTAEALAALRELAGKATPGPWEVTKRGIEGNTYDDVIVGGDVACMSHCYGESSTISGDRYEADANFVAAADPPTILALLDALDAATLKADIMAGSLAQGSRELDALAAEVAVLRRTVAAFVGTVHGLNEMNVVRGIHKAMRGEETNFQHEVQLNVYGEWCGHPTPTHVPVGYGKCADCRALAEEASHD